MIITSIYAKDIIKPYKEMYEDSKTIKVEGFKKVMKVAPVAVGGASKNEITIDYGVKKEYYPNGKLQKETEYSYDDIISIKNYNKQGIITDEKNLNGYKRYDDNGNLKSEIIYKFKADNINCVESEDECGPYARDAILIKEYYSDGKIKSQAFKYRAYIDYAKDGNVLNKYIESYDSIV